MAERQNIPLAVDLSSTRDLDGVVILYSNNGDGVIDVGMPHPENPYVTKLTDTDGNAIGARWGVFAPKGPLWVATLPPQAVAEAMLPLSYIYRYYSAQTPVDYRFTPPIDGEYTVAFSVPWLDWHGEEFSLAVSGLITLQLTDYRRQTVTNALSRYPTWSIEDILEQRST